MDEEIDALIDQEPQESASNSNVEVFADDGDEESHKSSDEETASNADSDDAPPNPLQWSNTLGGINVEGFSVRHGPSRDLGDNATGKDFFNLFINDEFLDEIVWHSIAYARSKGDATFVTNRAEISAYLGLNILIGIQELPQLAMYWDSDQFIGVEGFKKTIPKQRFATLGKYFHLADPNTEDRPDLLDGPSNSGKRAVSTFTTEENLRGHFLGKSEGRKRACAMCAKAGRKRKEGQGRTFKTSYACEQCGVPLCRQMRGEKVLL